jgi:GNAT superfamily N-acetyltransferase
MVLAAAIKARDIPQIRSVFGPQPLVRGFMEAWSTMVEPPLQIQQDPFMGSRFALITAADLPPATTLPEDYRIVDLLAWANENTDTLLLDLVVRDQARAIMEFLGAGGSNEDSSAGLKAVNHVLSNKLMGRYFVCFNVPSLNNLSVIDSDGPSPGPVAAYVFTGRTTTATISIRNVYTREIHRRKGLARALVKLATKYWLESVEEERRKTEVTLFIEPGNIAERVYRRCGFTITDVAYERRGWEGVEKGAF